MQSNRESEEIKNSEDKNIKKLREEFDKRQSQNGNHPKTSHGYKNSTNRNVYNINSKSCKKSPSRYTKALSANKYNQKVYKNSNKLNDKTSYDFCKKHPGYLYYKEIMSNIKNNKLNKIRTLTGKVINRRMKLEPAPKNIKNSNINNFFKNQQFPKIHNNHNNKINGRHKLYNYNYNYNHNNNQFDKNNPYSYFWANKILNHSDFKIGVKGMAYGVPQLGSFNKNGDFLLKVLNKTKEKDKNLENYTKNSFKSYHNGTNKNYYNNFVGITNQKNSKKESIIKGIFDENKSGNEKDNEKCFKIKNDENKNEMKKIFNEKIFENNKAKFLEDNNNKDNKNNKKDDNDNENEFEDESLDEELQKQFYKNQKNFFKARKDIMEEPEYLEDDNDNNNQKI